VSPETTPHARVAVIVRTKNRPLLLARALDSVLSQTYRDFTIVVVNDAGDVAPVQEQIDAVADRADGRILLVDNAVSRGREAAMNIGLAASSSTYVVIHDDDDAWAPTFLERTASHLDFKKAAHLCNLGGGSGATVIRAHHVLADSSVSG